MKKLFTAILAISALVACNRDYVVESLNQSVITFDDSFVEIKTRAAEDPSTTTASIDEFDVWGYMGKETGVVFEQKRVSKTDDVWTYDGLQYWMPGQKYYFAAVSPVGDPNIKVNTENRSFNAPTGLGVIEFTNEKGTNENGINVNGTTDLLYAEKSLTTDADATNEDKVHLQFAHMLSKVKFTFVNALPNDIEIKEIKITNAPKSASIDMTAETRAWANHADEVVLDFGNVNKGEKLGINKNCESDYARLTIPVGERDYDISFKVYVYHGTEAGEIVHYTTLTDAEFKIGKAYNLRAVISPENLGLQPIEFTVEDVEEWGDDDVYNIYAPEGDDDEPETPVVPEEPETPEPEQPGDVTELTIVSHAFGYTAAMETEVFFREATPGVEHLVDFRMTGIEAGTYNGDDNGIILGYCRYMYGSSDFGGGVIFDSANATITDNGDTTFTFDVTFVAEGAAYHFTYTTPAEEAEESGNTVQLVSKSAGEAIGSYYYGWTLADAEGNNSVKLVIDQAALDQATDFPKAHDYTAFKSSPTNILNGNHFSFVNKTLKVNGVTYANDAISNAKLTVVEATSITVEFTVDGEDYKFVYSI